jgi:sulfoxide reductase heme-binding subunit YedZ
VGMAGLLGMTPLAITSTAGWVRRMGYKRWQKLHRTRTRSRESIGTR